MVDFLKNLRELFQNEWRDAEGYEAVRTPSDETAQFQLLYNGSLVGKLWLSEGTWHFRYADNFETDSEVEPLVEFPNPNKEYTSDTLWPFFAFRIPSPKQPSVQKTVEDEGLDDTNEAELLKRFGRKTADNPFLLEAA